jgi:type III secretory pathway component EscU
MRAFTADGVYSGVIIPSMTIEDMSVICFVVYVTTPLLEYFLARFCIWKRMKK